MIRRNHVRRVLLRIEKQHPEHKDAICKVLSDENLLSQVVDHVKVYGAAPGERPVLEWLYAHKEDIIRFILMLVSMLAGGS